MNVHLLKKLKHNPTLTNEIRQQFQHYRFMMSMVFDRQRTKNKEYEAMAANQPHGTWGFMSLRCQEFSNCLVQLDLPYLKGLEPASSKGSIKRFTPRSIVLAVVVEDCLKRGLITESEAIACNAMKAGES